MKCIKCGRESADTPFCPFCGTKQQKPERKPKHRANGTGTVYRLPNGKYIATVTLGYPVDEDGTMHRKTRSKCFTNKRDALLAISELKAAKPKTVPTLRQLYDKWLPTHSAGRSTLDCYKSAFKHFSDIEFMRLDALGIDDYQECIDSCGHGRRTQENMRTCLGLMYKYGIPRHLIPDDLNLAQYLSVSGEQAAHRDAFTDIQIEQLRRCGAYETDTILCMIYLGFRPSEFLALTAASYDKAQHSFIGGAKTDAGRARTVTVSPKILPIIEKRVRSGGHIAGKAYSLQEFTERVFYPALELAGIDNPIVTVAGDTPRHKYTPHSCRHTFATLMKRAAGSDKDKLALIGHTSGDQLRDYQDVHYEDLRRITDAL